MLGAIAAIVIIIWFYNGARSVGKNPVQGAFVGFLIYFIPAIVWTVLVTPGLRDTVEHNPGLFLGLIVRYGFVVVGVSCAAWYRLKVLRKKPD